MEFTQLKALLEARRAKRAAEKDEIEAENEEFKHQAEIRRNKGDAPNPFGDTSDPFTQQSGDFDPYNHRDTLRIHGEDPYEDKTRSKYKR